MKSRRDRERLFVELYERHHGDVMAYLRRRTDEASASDAAAETFLTAWRRLEVAVDVGLPWLYRTAGLLLRNGERARRRQDRLSSKLAALPGPAPPPDPATALARHAEVLEALRTLPEDDRELLLLVTWEDLDIRAAAAATGRSPGATAVRLHRARRKLRRVLGEAAAKDPSATRPTTMMPEVTP